MRTIRKNQAPLKYSIQIAETPEFETIYYEDDDGNQYPIDVKPTGKTDVVYSEPIDFMASISMSGGEAEAVEYGLSIESFSAVIVTEKSAVPLKEGALIWHTSEPQLKHIDGIEVNGVVLDGDYPIKTSADFIVVSVRDSLNFTKVILDAVNK